MYFHNVCHILPLNRSEVLRHSRQAGVGDAEPEKAGEIVPSIVPTIALKNALTDRDRQ